MFSEVENLLARIGDRALARDLKRALRRRVAFRSWLARYRWRGGGPRLECWGTEPALYDLSFYRACPDCGHTAVAVYRAIEGAHLSDTPTCTECGYRFPPFMARLERTLPASPPRGISPLAYRPGETADDVRRRLAESDFSGDPDVEITIPLTTGEP